ncbi:MAG: stage II sporulation protein D [Firmicutes bacterium]|jgi:stage II sporulation protein D|nr:stage II sporulation protein D [Bacillota bacterium]MDH7494364.1 stage II sporulation protein D [Bacillota bacterium]
MDRAVIFSVGFCILVVLVVPSVLVRGCDYGVEPRQQAAGPTVRVFVTATGQTVEMPLDEYVRGVVAAEMPASFGTEALKAQAVAARTFAVKRMRQFGGPGCSAHPGADVCTDHLHCQAWISDDELRKKLGYLEYHAYARKIASAVESTSGKIVTYRGEPIEAYYHAASGGSTEDSEDVWQAAVPYLRAVSTEFEAREPSFQQLVEFTVTELEKRLGVKLTERKVRTYKVAGKDVQVVAEERMDRPIEVLSVTPAGRVREIRVGDKVFSGHSLRELLGLRSTKLTCRIVGDKVCFVTTGYGHGVGMSQYGAQVMAQAGKTYADILRHYYPGTEVTVFAALAPEQLP